MYNSIMAYEWFKELIDNEIKQELGTIENERLWSNGSAEDETAEMHENNIKTHEFYVGILKDAYREIIGENYDNLTNK